MYSISQISMLFFFFYISVLAISKIEINLQSEKLPETTLDEGQFDKNPVYKNKVSKVD